MLVLVHGPPASGKSLLAARLARATGLQLVSRDGIKEALLDGLWECQAPGPARERLRRKAGQRAFELFYTRIDELLQAGLSVLAEVAFHVGISEPQLGPALAHADAVVVYCTGSRELLRDRYLARHRAGEMHDCHVEPGDLEGIESDDFPWDRYGPLAIDVPVVMVDTSSPVDLVQLLDRLEGAVGHPVLGRAALSEELLGRRQ